MREPQHSVFFLQDATDRYTEDNMAEVISAAGNVLKIRVPNGIADSTYYDVVVTNKVDNPRGNIYEQITDIKRAEGRFFVIGADKGPVLSRIDPAQGPDTGETVQVTGRKFDELDFIEGLNNADSLSIKEVGVTTKALDDVLEGILGTEFENIQKRQDRVIHISYEKKDDATYNGELVNRVNRYIATYIGDRTTPLEVDGQPVYSFSEGFDNISVRLPTTTVSEATEVNVVLIMQTELETISGSHTIINIITNDNVKYTIIPSHTPPVISKIVPERIQVVEDRSTGSYGLKEDIVIGIEGQNFKVIRSRDPETNEDLTNYPVVGLGAHTHMDNANQGLVLRLNPENEGQVEIYRNKTWTPLPGADMVVLDSQGNIIDGTVGKDMGSKIIITLPKLQE